MIIVRVEQFDVVNGTALANAGICIAKILRRDMKEAATATKNLFGGMAMSNMLGAMGEEEPQATNEGENFYLNFNEEDWKPTLAEVEVFGTSVMTLSGSGAIPDVMSSKLCSQLHVTSVRTKRRIRMTNKQEAEVFGEVTNVLITIG